MDWIACEPIPDDYVAWYVDEMDLAGENPRALPLSAVEPEAKNDFSVLIIGCGESGLLAGIRLKEAGINFEILEKNEDVGGTWWENRYPGCRVDVASHYYSFSFEPNYLFSDYYARQPELYGYFRGLLDQHGIEEHVRWRCEVDRAVWDEESLALARDVPGTGRHRGDQVGQRSHLGCGHPQPASHPGPPEPRQIPGPVFHSAMWDHSVDLHGKRVALIGAGASGFQIGPAIVDHVQHLVVFQRTAQWMAPNPRYHASVKAGEQWAMRHLPGYSRWFRFILMWQSSDRNLELVRADPDWPDFPRTANASGAQPVASTSSIGSSSTSATTPSYSKRSLRTTRRWQRGCCRTTEAGSTASSNRMSSW